MTKQESYIKTFEIWNINERFDKAEMISTLRWIVNNSGVGSSDDVVEDLFDQIKSKEKYFRDRAIRYIRDNGGILYRCDNKIQKNHPYEIELHASFTPFKEIALRFGENYMIAIPYEYIQDHIAIAIPVELPFSLWYDSDEDEGEIITKGPLTIDSKYIVKI